MKVQFDMSKQFAKTLLNMFHYFGQIGTAEDCYQFRELFDQLNRRLKRKSVKHIKKVPKT